MNRVVWRSAWFLTDFERNYRWYWREAGALVARRYLEAVEQAIATLSVNPGLGRERRFAHPELKGIHAWLLPAPFSEHLIFYRHTDDRVTLERLIHGRRDLPARLLEHGTG